MEWEHWKWSYGLSTNPVDPVMGVPLNEPLSKAMPHGYLLTMAVVSLLKPWLPWSSTGFLHLRLYLMGRLILRKSILLHGIPGFQNSTIMIQCKDLAFKILSWDSMAKDGLLLLISSRFLDIWTFSVHMKTNFAEVIYNVFCTLQKLIPW